MKGVFRFTMMTVSLLGAMASCSDMEVAEVNGRYPEVITATIAEPDGQAQSRTCVDMSDTGNGYLGLLWQQNDSIGVYSQSGTTRNALFRSLTAGNAKQADFGGEMSTGDYKYGAPVSGSKRFNFRHLFTLLRVSINAAGTPLEGEKLESIELTVTDSQGNERPICGDFKFSAVDGQWWGVENASGSVSMPWTTRPALTQDETYLGFITVMPVVKAGDKIAVTVISEAHKASFTATCKVDFQAEHVYNIPLTLSGYADKPEFGYEVKTRPVIKSFGFSVSKNPSKILDKQLIWNSSNDPQFNAVSQQTATIQGDAISLMIPYLYHFKLIPEFTVSEGATVTVDDVEQKSGETEVDFSKPVTYAVTANGETRHYTVNITNTGLPVVVLHQSSTGDFSKVYQGGVTIGGTNIGGKLVNKFVDFMVRGKETDWVEDDTFTVYNADGTVNVDAALCGIRLRGNTTQTYPKKPFAVKLKSKKAVLDMPAHKRWVLLANWLDHSMIRNAVAFEVAHAMENGWKAGTVEQGIPWNVHGQNVELVMDGRHVGNYYLCEQIKIGSTRLDIHDPYEDVLADQGEAVATFENCGYLLELDNNYDENYKFITSHYSVPFMFKDDVLSDGILNAVKQKIQGIEDKIYAGDFASAYNDLDIYTVIDQWLIWELTMNHEYIEPRSVYYFMDGNGKLSAGPVWDFDRATFQNVENAQAQGSSGDRVKPYDQWICWSANPKAGLTASNLTNGSSCIWYPELIADPIFQKAVQERWTVMYPYLQGVVNNIRQLGVKMACSYEVNNAMWPTTKAAIHEHKSGFTDWSGDENIAAYSDVIDNFVTVYQARLAGMNNLITSGKFTK